MLNILIKLNSILRTLLISFLFSGCNTASTIVIGNARAPITVDQVKIVTSLPAVYEEIALIEATGKTGFTDQQKTNGAIEALKAKAASIGANVIFIQSFTDQDFLYKGTSSVNKKVQGKALHVP